MKTLFSVGLFILTACGSGTNSIAKSGLATATPETPQTSQGSIVTVTLQAFQGTRISPDAVIVSGDRLFTPPSTVTVQSGIPYCQGPSGLYSCSGAAVNRRARLLIGGAVCEYAAGSTNDAILALISCSGAVAGQANNIDDGTVIQLENYDAYNQVLTVTFDLEAR